MNTFDAIVIAVTLIAIEVDTAELVYELRPQLLLPALLWRNASREKFVCAFFAAR